MIEYIKPPIFLLGHTETTPIVIMDASNLNSVHTMPARKNKKRINQNKESRRLKSSPIKNPNKKLIIHMAPKMSGINKIHLIALIKGVFMFRF